MKNPWTFTKWIALFEGVDLPIGDLADDISRSKDFPVSEDKRIILGYLKNKEAHTLALETFLNVWDFYKSST